MATLVSALNTSFTPTAADFVVQANGGSVDILTRISDGDAWCLARGGRVQAGESVIVDNVFVGSRFMLVAADGRTPTVKAEE